ncbi:hypothetical protein ACFCWM_40130, partial [Streptomyces noursei]
MPHALRKNISPAGTSTTALRAAHSERAATERAPDPYAGYPEAGAVAGAPVDAPNARAAWCGCDGWCGCGACGASMAGSGHIGGGGRPPERPGERSGRG